MSRSIRLQFPPPLLLLLLLIAATLDRGHTMTNYRSALYEIPYSGLVPPNIVGTGLDDDFSNSRPAKLLGGVPFENYASPQAKWRVFNSDGELNFFGVDCRLQALLLTGSPEKAWCGLYQQLPDTLLPTVIGQTKQIAVYLRSSIAFIDSDIDAYDGLKQGILLGQDLLAAPTTSAIIAVHATSSRAPDVVDDVPAVNGSIEASVFANFEALGTVGGRVYGWPSCAYTRLRLKQRMDGIGNFAYQWSADTASFGNDWVTLIDSDEVTGQAAPWKSVGVGINGNAFGFGAYFDLFRVMVQPLGDLTKTIGGTTTLGAV